MSNQMFHFLARVLIALAAICATQNFLEERLPFFFFNVIIIAILAATDASLDD